MRPWWGIWFFLVSSAFAHAQDVDNPAMRSTLTADALLIYANIDTAGTAVSKVPFAFIRDAGFMAVGTRADANCAGGHEAHVIDLERHASLDAVSGGRAVFLDDSWADFVLLSRSTHGIDIDEALETVVVHT